MTETCTKCDRCKEVITEKPNGKIQAHLVNFNTSYDLCAKCEVGFKAFINGCPIRHINTSTETSTFVFPSAGVSVAGHPLGILYDVEVICKKA